MGLGSGWSYPSFSGSIYGDIYTTAPKTLDPVTQDSTTMKAMAFVEDITCNNGQGPTYSKNRHLIAPRFRARQEVTGPESSLSREKQEGKRRGCNC